MRLWLGSICFTSVFLASAVVQSLFSLVLRLFGYRVLYAGMKLWCQSMLTLLRWFCGLDYTVRGLERLPQQNTVLLMKHSSTWEIVAQLVLFPNQTWVMKRELIWTPILGWALSCLKPIPINRKGGRAAVTRVIECGRKRLEEGLWIIIFPEGTRVPAGETRRYGLSGTLLAQAQGLPVVPVAHNAGDFWPRRGLLKHPGTIQVVVGDPIATADRDPREVNREVQNWIETEIAAMQAPD